MSVAVSLRRFRRRGLPVLFVLPAMVAPAWAADAAAVQAAPVSSFASLLQVLLGLGLVLGAIAGTAWLLRRIGPGQVGASGALRVVGGVAVGPKERVVLVDVGDTRLVLGVTSAQVTALHQMPRPAESATPEATAGLHNPFAQRLKEALGKIQNRGQHAAD